MAFFKPKAKVEKTPGEASEPVKPSPSIGRKLITPSDEEECPNEADGGAQRTQKRLRRNGDGEAAVQEQPVNVDTAVRAEGGPGGRKKLFESKQAAKSNTKKKKEKKGSPPPAKRLKRLKKCDSSEEEEEEEEEAPSDDDDEEFAASESEASGDEEDDAEEEDEEMAPPKKQKQASQASKRPPASRAPTKTAVAAKKTPATASAKAPSKKSVQFASESPADSKIPASDPSPSPSNGSRAAAKQSGGVHVGQFASPALATVASDSTSIGECFYDEEEQASPFRYYHFLRRENRKDCKGRPMADPEYDPTTLWIPAEVKNKKGVAVTAAKQQWWQFKSANFDCVLLFKQGKFYETFEMDAAICHHALGLNYMAQHGEDPRPHAGFPEKQYDKFVAQLAAAGFRCAVIEQTETPAQLAERNSKTSGKKAKVVMRELCQIVTKGTRAEGSLLTGSEPVYLMAVKEQELPGDQVELGVVLLDCATGKFHLAQFHDDDSRNKLHTMVEQANVAEVIHPRNELSSATHKVLKYVGAPDALFTAMNPELFKESAEEVLQMLQVDNYLGTEQPLPEALQDGGALMLSALSGCVSYLERILLDTELISLRNFNAHDPATPLIATKGCMMMDGKCLSNLEITHNTFDQGHQFTLFNALNHTVTSFGQRLFQQWVCQPLLDAAHINARLDAVEELMQHSDLFSEVSVAMKKLPDLERLLARVHANSKSTTRPDPHMFDLKTRKLDAFLETLTGLNKLQAMMKKIRQQQPELTSPALRGVIFTEDGFPDIETPLREISEAFDSDEAKHKGAVIPRRGFNAEFDESADTIDEIKASFQEYLKEVQSELGRGVKYVTLQKEQYLLEVNESVSAPGDYEKVSSKKGSGKNPGVVRYSTERRKELLAELDIATEAQDEVLKRAGAALYGQFSEHYPVWSNAVACIAELDALLSLTRVSEAAEGVMARPSFVDPDDQSRPVLDIREGRHPCESAANFIPNDVLIGGTTPATLLITGPNMGGKSTILRQTCAIVIMAQLGCYVPAASCTLTPVDRIFTRLGASDNIMMGQSTFYIELSDTAVILTEATSRSLVILDELGRGTSTLDGTAIAYAVTHSLVVTVKCRCMFATHYHLLTEEYACSPEVGLAHMGCVIDEDEDSSHPVTFLYKLQPGALHNSFGLNVGKMAGLDSQILQKAGKVSQRFEAVLAQGRSAVYAQSLSRVSDTNDIRNLWSKLNYIRNK